MSQLVLLLKNSEEKTTSVAGDMHGDQHIDRTLWTTRGGESVKEEEKRRGETKSGPRGKWRRGGCCRGEGEGGGTEEERRGRGGGPTPKTRHTAGSPPSVDRITVTFTSDDSRP